MKYVIPITPAIYQEKSQLFTRHATQSIRETAIKGMISGAIIILLSAWDLFVPIIQYILAGIGATLIILYGIYFLILRRITNKHNKEAAKYYTTPGQMTIEFTDEHYIYHDNFIESKVSWDMIRSYTIIDDVLFLSYLETAYMLAKKEVSENDFDDIVGFLKTKVPYKQNIYG